MQEAKQKTKQKKRFIIKLNGDIYLLKSKGPVFWTQFADEATLLSKKKAGKEEKRLQSHYPAAQILEWKPPKPGRWEAVKQKTKLQPVTAWMPLKASNEFKLTSEFIIRGIGIRSEINYNYRVGLGLLLVAHLDLTSKSKDGTIIITTRPLSKRLKWDVLAIDGWGLKSVHSGTDVQWEWSFTPSEVSKPKPVADSKTARANTDNAFPLDEALGRFYTGINYLATRGVLGARGQMILTKSTTSYRDKKKALLDIGWELKEHPDDGCLWSFSWGQPSTVELTKKQGSNIAKGYTILEKYGLASVHITPQEHQVSRENRLKETTVTPEDMEILKSLGWQPDSRINTGWKYLETLTPSVMGKVKLEPVTDSETKETEAEADSGEETTRLKLIQGIYDGLEVAFQYDHEFNLTDGYAEIVLEGKEVPMDTDILSECGWERMESSGDGDAIWHFEIGKDSIHSVYSLCLDSGHTEAHCPQKVSKSGWLELKRLDVC